MDFYFKERNQALRFISFLESKIPVTTKYARKLVTADNKANIGNFKHNHVVTIAPVCKDDIMLLPKDLSRSLGNICQLVLVKQISAAIQIVDPFTCEQQEINSEKFFRYNIKSLMTTRQFTKFIVLSVEPLLMKERACVSNKRGHDKRSQLAECVVAREKDFGVNDTQFTVQTHLGNLLREGDTALGYDLTCCPWAEDEVEKTFGSRKHHCPDIILVRKVTFYVVVVCVVPYIIFLQHLQNKRDRIWELKSLEIDATEQLSSKEAQYMEEEYEGFLQELESDKEMRSGVNLYKKSAMSSELGKMDETGCSDNDDDDDNNDDVKLDELLNDLVLERGDEPPKLDVELSILTAEEAAVTQPKIDLNEGSDTVFNVSNYDPKDFKF